MGQISRGGEQLCLQDAPQKFLDHRLAIFPYGETQILQLVLDASEKQCIYKSQRTGWRNRKVCVAHECKAGLQGVARNWC